MREIDGRIMLSASDLMRFMGCRHATMLDLAHMRGDGPEPREDSADTELLQQLGDAHEAAHLSKLRGSGKRLVEIDHGDLADNARDTRAAIEGGADAIFQGAFVSGCWGGWSDFLERVDKPSRLGDFSYEVTDTKLKRRPHPKHVLQLALYSDMLAEVQGAHPENAHVELGDGSRATFRLASYAHYARAARARLEAFIAAPETTRPVPCADCALCRWGDHCESVWQGEDSLFNVAGITRGQVGKLETAGITTMAALATHDAPVRGMAAATLERLKKQARLQHARKTGEPNFELRPREPGKGFDLLPQPRQGDLFYDIEGDPHYEGGLEYLHGLRFDGNFRAFWAHDHAAEAQALSDLLDHFRDHLNSFPDARIYHYASYELTALRRLTTKHGIGEAFLDRLLREWRFVDLYSVVRGGLIASESDYSIKSIEAFYDLEREGEVQTAGGSVIAYEKWRETGDQTILDEIEDYNRVDCESTERLRDWLVSIRGDASWPEPRQDAEDQETAEDEEVQALRKDLAVADLPEERRETLFNLGFFHKREAKPAQWAVFDSVGKDEDDLIDDPDSLGGLEAIGAPGQVQYSHARTYGFPPQETKLRTGRRATVPVPEGPPATISIQEMDLSACRIVVKAGSRKAHLLTDRLTLHPDWPLNTDVIAAALRGVIKDQCTSRSYRAVDDLLSARAPRLKKCSGDILGNADPVSGTIGAVARMDETVLSIQGPPGTGKTHVTALAILSLVQKGHRVGVTSNSHEAIRNVLMGCLGALETRHCDTTLDDVQIAHKVSGRDDGYPDDCTGIRRTTSNADFVLSHAQIVGGTAFFFSRDENEQAFDWLFVDEAGQVGLANMVAMGRAARNIVLVGDPRQLPQVIQGAHPPPANLSCLEWMLGDHATVPPDRGIFLPTTRRMHPDVCKFVSEQVYEGRLECHPDTARQGVADTTWPETGAFWVPVFHEGNAQMAPEEIRAIRTAIRELLSGTWTDRDNTTRPMRKSDIIVVAPYNVQVNALRDALPGKIRVGTVDKFQGQEAPVCLISMTASSTEETSRGMDFLFSLNRINVAVSRAKGLALVFGSQRLREARCDTVEQMRLVNTLCRLPTVD